MPINLSTSVIPCECNTSLFCFIPGLISVLLLGELSILIIEIISRSRIGGIPDFTNTSVWENLTPIINTFWTLFWAIIVQNVFKVKNMFPGLLPNDNSSKGGIESKLSEIPR